MSLSNKEKALQYILSKDIPPDGKLFLGIIKLQKLDGISHEEFLRQLLVLEDEKLITIFFHGYKDINVAVTITVSPKAQNYFTDKKKIKKNKTLQKIALTSREIIMLAIGAIFAGIVAIIVDLITG